MAMQPGLVFAAVLVAGLAGCSSGSAPVDPSSPTVLLSGSGDGSGADASIAGPVTLDDKRCVGIDGRLVIWPAGTTWDGEANGVRLPNGAVVRLGESVAGGGFYVAGASAQSSLADIEQRGRCAWDGETAIFNPGSDVERVS
jgi:hypothetical protein